MLYLPQLYFRQDIKPNLIRLTVLIILLTPMASMANEPEAERAYPIAGVQPDQRPAGAPTIAQTNKGNGWYVQALHGLSTPYPASLKFLENQGNWFTPFTRPGMTGPYDIRGWHQE